MCGWLDQDVTGGAGVWVARAADVTGGVGDCSSGYMSYFNS